MKRGLIVGHQGQDGQLLSSFLRRKGYEILGVGRAELDILNPEAVLACLKQFRPSEVYYLAAYHHSSEMLPETNETLLKKSMDVHVHGLRNFLVPSDVKAKFFYASSSHIFGSQDVGKQTEATMLEPASPYAQSKIQGMKECEKFREQGGFASVGILYNHESPLRSPHFVTRKITKAVAEIVVGKRSKLELGNLDVEIDWGFAGDFIEAMWQILQLEAPSDFIISTGIPHTLREFVSIAFHSQGLDYKEYIELNPSLVKKKSQRRIGDFSKLQNATGWKPKLSFEDMIKEMVKNDLNLLKA